MTTAPKWQIYKKYVTGPDKSESVGLSIYKPDKNYRTHAEAVLKYGENKNKEPCQELVQLLGSSVPNITFTRLYTNYWTSDREIYWLPINLTYDSSWLYLAKWPVLIATQLYLHGIFIMMCICVT